MCKAMLTSTGPYEYQNSEPLSVVHFFLLVFVVFFRIFLKPIDGFFKGIYVILEKKSKTINPLDPNKLGVFPLINLKRIDRFSLRNHSKLFVCDLVED